MGKPIVILNAIAFKSDNVGLGLFQLPKQLVQSAVKELIDFNSKKFTELSSEDCDRVRTTIAKGLSVVGLCIVPMEEAG